MRGINNMNNTTIVFIHAAFWVSMLTGCIQDSFSSLNKEEHNTPPLISVTINDNQKSNIYRYYSILYDNKLRYTTYDNYLNMRGRYLDDRGYGLWAGKFNSLDTPMYLSGNTNNLEVENNKWFRILVLGQYSWSISEPLYEIKGEHRQILLSMRNYPTVTISVLDSFTRATIKEFSIQVGKSYVVHKIDDIDGKTSFQLNMFENIKNNIQSISIKAEGYRDISINLYIWDIEKPDIDIGNVYLTKKEYEYGNDGDIGIITDLNPNISNYSYCYNFSGFKNCQFDNYELLQGDCIRYVDGNSIQNNISNKLSGPAGSWVSLILFRDCRLINVSVQRKRNCQSEIRFEKYGSTTFD
jgi:hypothetical protein